MHFSDSGEMAALKLCGSFCFLQKIQNKELKYGNFINKF